jgi:hypothetical protein
MEPWVNAAANLITRSYNRAGDSLGWRSRSALYRVLGPLAERAFEYAADATSQQSSFRMEHPMINWPNVLHDMEHWADGFLTGAAATSLIAIAGVAIVLLARAM